ncbi:MAG: glycosyltransferase family 2 protein [Planctomycetota bacterium]|nr:glycosyltransferase family 2 protein [Planctomycetota bacterium]
MSSTLTSVSSHVEAQVSPSTSDKEYDVVIVIPAYNEQDAVGPTVDRVRAAMDTTHHSFDILVVDDGSTDDTTDAAIQHGARVITLQSNGGYGAALKTGIRASRSKFVAIIDADGTYPEHNLPAMIHRAENVDMVVGARDQASKAIPFMRRPAKRFLTWLASYLAGRIIPDLNSGLRIIRRSAVEQFLPIFPQGFSFTTTSTLAMLCTNHRVVYEPIEYLKRVGHSKIRPVDFFNFLILVLRTIVLFNPLKVFVPAGCFLAAVGAGSLVYDVYTWNLSDSTVMTILAAMMIWSIGLLADMISRLQLYPVRVRSMT